jgi:formamidopyrimidine-DNA glycosylase
MFELPEMVNLAGQFNQTLRGKTVRKGSLGNSPHKFVWYNRSHDEFETLTTGKTIGETRAKGRWLLTDLDPGYRLVLGECGGKVLYHPTPQTLPAKYHLCLEFVDGSYLTGMTQMWGAFELYEAGLEMERQYIKDMRPTPIDAEFTLEYFSSLIDELNAGEKRSAKALLTQEQLIPGLGNAIAQDILFQAGLHPRHPLTALNLVQRGELYRAILETVQAVIEKGGRYDEVDLYNQPGGYVRMMDSRSADKPCPVCATPIEKIQYLGGACYFCPGCQE